MFEHINIATKTYKSRYITLHKVINQYLYISLIHLSLFLLFRNYLYLLKNIEIMFRKFISSKNSIYNNLYLYMHKSNKE